jgi:hypothetical protein
VNLFHEAAVQILEIFLADQSEESRFKRYKIEGIAEL